MKDASTRVRYSTFSCCEGRGDRRYVVDSAGNSIRLSGTGPENREPGNRDSRIAAAGDHQRGPGRRPYIAAAGRRPGGLSPRGGSQLWETGGDRRQKQKTE